MICEARHDEYARLDTVPPGDTAHRADYRRDGARDSVGVVG